MKNLAILLFTLIAFASCESDGFTENDANSNLVVEVPSKSKSFLTVLNETKLLAEEKGQRITFDLVLTEDGSFVKENIQFHPHFRAVDAIVYGATGIKKDTSRSWEVTCHNSDGTTTTTTCATQDEQCLSNAVTSCLNSGGCVTICNMKLQYTPSSVLK
jgi:hypothetical protein